MRWRAPGCLASSAKNFSLEIIKSKRTQRWLCMLVQPFFVCSSNRNRGRDTFCVLYMIETDGFGNNETIRRGMCIYTFLFNFFNLLVGELHLLCARAEQLLKEWDVPLGCTQIAQAKSIPLGLKSVFWHVPFRTGTLVG